MTAFRASFADMKLVKTRQVAQLIFEIPIEEFDAAYEVLGGMPVPSKERWFGIAAIKTTPQTEDRPATPDHKELKPDQAKRNWRDIQPAAQAGIRCAEPTFRAFLNETRRQQFKINNQEEAAEAVREICGVHSRVELGTKQAARMIWKQLDDEFTAWKAMEHA